MKLAKLLNVLNCRKKNRLNNGFCTVQHGEHDRVGGVKMHCPFFILALQYAVNDLSLI